MKLGGRRLLLKFRRYSRSSPIYGFAGKSRIAEGRCDLREIGDSVAMQLSSYGSELLVRRQLRCGVEQVRRGAGAAWSRCGVEQVLRGAGAAVLPVVGSSPLPGPLLERPPWVLG